MMFSLFNNWPQKTFDKTLRSWCKYIARSFLCNHKKNVNDTLAVNMRDDLLLWLILSSKQSSRHPLMFPQKNLGHDHSGHDNWWRTANIPEFPLQYDLQLKARNIGLNIWSQFIVQSSHSNTWDGSVALVQQKCLHRRWERLRILRRSCQSRFQVVWNESNCRTGLKWEGKSYASRLKLFSLSFRVSWRLWMALMPQSLNFDALEELSGQPTQVWCRTGTFKTAYISFLISNIVFDDGKFKFSVLFSFVYWIRSWYIGGGSADTNSTSSENPSFVMSVRKMLFSLDTRNDFNMVVSIWASLLVELSQPLICWRQRGTDVFCKITSLRSSTKRKVTSKFCNLEYIQRWPTYRFEIGDGDLMNSAIEMHIKYQIVCVIWWRRSWWARRTFNREKSWASGCGISAMVFYLLRRVECLWFALQEQELRWPSQHHWTASYLPKPDEQHSKKRLWETHTDLRRMAVQTSKFQPVDSRWQIAISMSSIAVIC